MDSTCLRHTEIPGTSKLFADFAYHFEKVSRFYSHNPYSPESFTTAAAQIKYPAGRRAAMAKALAAQNPGHPLLKRFAEPGTVAVVTGQQVGLFTGPAYTLFKALTAIRLAEFLTVSGTPAVPIFWLASEDHDFPEVANTWVYDRNHQPVKLTVSEPAGLASRPKPVGPLHVDAPIDDLRAALSGFPNAEDVVAMAADAYANSATLAEGFRKLALRILGPDRILTINPLDPAVREIGAPFMADALRTAPELKSGLLKRNEELSSAGYHAQVLVEPQTSLFFLLDKGERKTLRLKDHEFTTLADRAADVSPNALLRPVWEDYMLPTVCYVGGPGELAYFAQSEVLYSHLLARMPVVLPRAGYTLVDSRAARLLNRYQLRVQETFCRPDLLREKVARALTPDTLVSGFESTAQKFQRHLSELQAQVETLDPTLGSAVETSKAKILYQVEKSRLKVQRELLRRDAQASEHTGYLCNTFFPHGHLQERFYTILPFLAQHGLESIARLGEQLRWDCPDHRISEID